MSSSSEQQHDSILLFIISHQQEALLAFGNCEMNMLREITRIWGELEGNDTAELSGYILMEVEKKILATLEAVAHSWHSLVQFGPRQGDSKDDVARRTLAEKWVSKIDAIHTSSIVLDVLGKECGLRETHVRAVKTDVHAQSRMEAFRTVSLEFFIFNTILL